ncbi:HEPACAM family member 2 isoform X2 [Electrophorus electricus]|uniref:HEPACAM family member 2 isoform X2 n=1 Tax=Electrophorus electricus TaxID=8005 RepID=UPI0015D01489|nr:HEPACAM family member 2 isoform X2 [Electrophorus electricus]
MSCFRILMLFLWSFVGKGTDGCKELHVKGVLRGQVELPGHFTNSQDVQIVSWSKYTTETSSKSLLLQTEGNTSVNYSQNIYFSKHNMSLTLLNLTANDEAIYEILKVFKNSTIIRCNVSLTVSLPLDALRIAVSSSNFTLNLSCEVKGDFLLLRWLKNDLPLPLDQRVSFSEMNTSMQVSNLTSADCVKYTCQVSNAIEKSEAHKTITGEIILPAGFSLIGILLLCIILVLIKKGCYNKDPSNGQSTEPVYETPAFPQEGTPTSVVNPLAYVYTDFIKPRSFQQPSATDE